LSPAPAGDGDRRRPGSSLGNVLGGIGLVTSIRLLRVSHQVEEAQHDAPEDAGDQAG
jgi:hypothetical protein